MEKIKEFLRKINPSLRMLSSIMLILYLLFILLPVGKNIPDIRIDVNIQKIEDPNHMAVFYYDGMHLIKLILLGPVFGIFYFLTIQHWLHYIEKSQNSADPSDKQRLTENKRRWIEFINLNITMGVVIGTILHWLFDKANFFYHTENGYDLSQTYGFIYYCDEYLAHTIIHISYFLMVLLTAWLEHLDPRKRKMNWVDGTLAIFLIIGISILHGYAALKGESALIMWIFNVLAACIIAVWIFIKKIRLLEHPILLIQIIVGIVVTIENLIFLSKEFIISDYPFITAT